jgi:DNA helicase HerA-like ATPase
MELFSWIKKNPAGDRPLGGLLVMDEAQLFAPSRESTPSLRSTLDLVTQARKYGLGLVFATQAPKNLHNNITGNTATQFFGRLTAPVHIDAAEQVARARGGQLGKIAQLEPGVFFGATEGRSFERVKVPYCLSYHPNSPLTEEEAIAKAAAVSGGPGMAGRIAPSL